MALNWVMISLWLGGFLILASVLSFVWHWRKEKKQINQKQSQFGMNQIQQDIQQGYRNQQPYQQNQMQMINPYVYGTNEYWNFEKNKQVIQQPQMQSQFTQYQSNPQEEVMRQLKLKNDELEYKMSLLKSIKDPYKIMQEPANTPIIVEPKQEAKKIIDEDIKSEKKTGFSIDIQLLESPLADFESAEIMKNEIENELKTMLKTFKKTMKNKNVDIDISYELN